MKNVRIFVIACTAALSLSAAEITLPAPARKGGLPLNEALSLRRTCRSYTARTLAPAEISQLLWSAFGVNREDGKRTAPTARNRQEITLYLITAKGAWAYAAKSNKLPPLSTKDLRRCAGRFDAPAYIAIVSSKKLSGDSPRSLHFAAMDAGYVSQNIYLACASMGLGTCAIGSIPDPAALARELRLTDSESVLLTHSVGAPK